MSSSFFLFVCWILYDLQCVIVSNGYRSQRPEKITILYGSQSGNTENLSKQLKEDLERRGIECKAEAMNDVDVSSVQSLKNVIFLTSTAGQGEFPRNAKDFYDKLTQLPQGSLKGLNYCVFGLGDRGYVQFNKAAKDLASALETLGGENMLPVVFGDDRDDEKYETKYYEWLPSLYSVLHAEKIVNEIPPSPKYTVTPLKPGQTKEKPFKPLRSHLLPLKKVERLTEEGYDRDIRHFEIDLTGTKVKYNIGDTLGIYPQNHKDQVDQLLKDLELNGEDLVKIQKGEEIRRTFVPGVITMDHLFTEVLDIFGRPTRRFYSMLSRFATDPKEKAELESMMTQEGASVVQNIIAETMTYADVLRKYPSAKPALPFLIDMIPTMKPRFYSIASSPLMKPSTIDLCIVGVNWKTPSGKQRYGQCTSYLHQLKADGHTTIRAAVAPGTMQMPADSKYPIIMAGLGTGIAPFKAITEHRVAQFRAGLPMGETALFYGCRYRKEFVYPELWKQYQEEGALTHVIPAFSREQSYKIYVQDKIVENSKMVTDYLMKQNGSFYYCGLAGKAPAAIRKGIMDAFVKEMGISEDKADAYLQQMEGEGRYNLECW